MMSTMRRISLWRVALKPAIKRVIAKVSAVAAIAIVKRRRRNCKIPQADEPHETGNNYGEVSPRCRL